MVGKQALPATRPGTCTCCSLVRPNGLKVAQHSLLHSSLAVHAQIQPTPALIHHMLKPYQPAVTHSRRRCHVQATSHDTSAASSAHSMDLSRHHCNRPYLTSTCPAPIGGMSITAIPLLQSSPVPAMQFRTRRRYNSCHTASATAGINNSGLAHSTAPSPQVPLHTYIPAPTFAPPHANHQPRPWVIKLGNALQDDQPTPTDNQQPPSQHMVRMKLVHKLLAAFQPDPPMPALPNVATSGWETRTHVGAAASNKQTSLPVSKHAEGLGALLEAAASITSIKAPPSVPSRPVLLLTEGGKELYQAVTLLANQQPLHNQLYPGNLLAFTVQPTHPPSTTVSPAMTTTSENSTTAASRDGPTDLASSDSEQAIVSTEPVDVSITGDSKTTDEEPSKSSFSKLIAAVTSHTHIVPHAAQSSSITQDGSPSTASMDVSKDGDSSTLDMPPLWSKELALTLALSSVPVDSLEVPSGMDIQTLKVHRRDTINRLCTWLMSALEERGHLRLTCAGWMSTEKVIKAVLHASSQAMAKYGLGVAVRPCVMQVPAPQPKWYGAKKIIPQIVYELDCMYCIPPGMWTRVQGAPINVPSVGVVSPGTPYERQQCIISYLDSLGKAEQQLQLKQQQQLKQHMPWQPLQQHLPNLPTQPLLQQPEALAQVQHAELQHQARPDAQVQPTQAELQHVQAQEVELQGQAAPASQAMLPTPLAQALSEDPNQIDDDSGITESVDLVAPVSQPPAARETRRVKKQLIGKGTRGEGRRMTPDVDLRMLASKAFSSHFETPFSSTVDVARPPPPHHHHHHQQEEEQQQQQQQQLKSPPRQTVQAVGQPVKRLLGPAPVPEGSGPSSSAMMTSLEPQTSFDPTLNVAGASLDDAQTVTSPNTPTIPAALEADLRMVDLHAAHATTHAAATSYLATPGKLSATLPATDITDTLEDANQQTLGDSENSDESVPAYASAHRTTRLVIHQQRRLNDKAVATKVLKYTSPGSGCMLLARGNTQVSRLHRIMLTASQQLTQQQTAARRLIWQQFADRQAVVKRLAQQKVVRRAWQGQLGTAAEVAAAADQPPLPPPQQQQQVPLPAEPAVQVADTTNSLLTRPQRSRPELSPANTVPQLPQASQAILSASAAPTLSDRPARPISIPTTTSTPLEASTSNHTSSLSPRPVRQAITLDSASQTLDQALPASKVDANDDEAAMPASGWLTAGPLQEPVPPQPPPEQVLVFKVRKYPDEDDSDHFHLFPSFYGLAVHAVQLDAAIIQAYLAAAPPPPPSPSGSRTQGKGGVIRLAMERRGGKKPVVEARERGMSRENNADVSAEVSSMGREPAWQESEKHVVSHDVSHLEELQGLSDLGALEVVRPRPKGQMERVKGEEGDEEGEEDRWRWEPKSEEVSLETDSQLRYLVESLLWMLAKRGCAVVEAVDQVSRSKVLHAVGYVNDVLLLRGRMEAVTMVTNRVSAFGRKGEPQHLDTAIFTILLATDFVAGALGNPALAPVAPIQQKHPAAPLRSRPMPYN